jgi:hypothetical protein
MKLVQISNLFNQICQGINAQTAGRIGFYHYGYYSDININIQNNWTGTNTVGVLYPSVLFLYPTAQVEIKEKSVKGTLNCSLIFSDLQYYNNDASTNQRSIIEVQSDLEDLAVNVLSEFNRVGRTPNYQCGITGAIDIHYLSDAHNNSLVLLETRFTIYYIWDCPTDVVDIAGLPAPFDDIPPPTTDYEQE